MVPRGKQPKQTLYEMVLAALEKAGGVSFLTQFAQEESTAFVSLLGKVLPMQKGAETPAEGHDAGARDELAAKLDRIAEAVGANGPS